MKKFKLEVMVNVNLAEALWALIAATTLLLG
jgi:hypothetical protein